VFMSGRSQAVRLPKEFRFDVDEVMIERTVDGVLLRAKTKAQLVREYFAQPSLVPADFLLIRDQGVPERDDPLGLLNGSFAEPVVAAKPKLANSRK
jgi:antitoxin VapB